MFVAAGSFEPATAACTAAGFEAGGSVVSNATDLLGRALQRPTRAVTLALESPDELLPYIRRQLAPGAPTRRGLVDRHYRDGDLDVHLFNHLAYASPMNGAKIRVDPAVERAMLERRVEGSVGAVPAPPDELLHLVCRGVFDYEGAFPSYYTRRCDHLADAVGADETADGQFRRMLEPVFFEASTLVYDLVMAGDYDDIRPSLLQFAGY